MTGEMSAFGTELMINNVCCDVCLQGGTDIG